MGKMPVTRRDQGRVMGSSLSATGTGLTTAVARTMGERGGSVRRPQSRRLPAAVDFTLYAEGSGYVLLDPFSVPSGSIWTGLVAIAGATNRVRVGAADAIWGEVPSGGGEVRMPLPLLPDPGEEIPMWAGSVDNEAVWVSVGIWTWGGT